MDTKLYFIPIIIIFGILFTMEPFSNYMTQMQNKIVIMINTAYPGLFSTSNKSSPVTAEGILLTKDELKQYDGQQKTQLYMAVVGSVFDVTKGERFYAPGNHYGGFCAKDGTRAFVTGQFNEEGLVEDISDFSDLQMHEVYDWVKFYQTSYTYVGKVIGHFYDKHGQPTEYYKQYESGVESAKEHKKAQADDRKMFPPCNSEWKQASGSRVWCTKRSGGIERDWVGVPRKYHKPGERNTRCACIKTSGSPSGNPNADTKNGDLKNPNLQEYKDCPYLSESCNIVKD